MLFGGPWERPFPPYFVQYLHPVGFFFFSLFLSRPLLVRMCALRDVVFFVLVGVVVIATWTGRGSGDCVAFLFLFVCAGPVVVLGLRCPWSWRRLRFPRRSPTGSLEAQSVSAKTVAAWSSPD